MKINIDPNAGFCFGVTKVVNMAEEILKKEGHLYCLGEIVHNVMEIKRLKKLGLEMISNEQYHSLANCKVLIRAHGEPPETYIHALKNNIEIIDGTCPIVLRLQSSIESDYKENDAAGAQIVIYGRKDHAEVRGLAGQTGHKSIIVESEHDLDKINFSKPVHIYAQTTMNRVNYNKIVSEIQKRITQADHRHELAICNNSICGQVSGRIPRLKKFCQEHDIVIFASSAQSSNGRSLFKQCKMVNDHSYFVSEMGELQLSWFRKSASVGITGATSSPRWFLEEIAAYLKKNVTT